jgi:hypothetical protein
MHIHGCIASLCRVLMMCKNNEGIFLDDQLPKIREDCAIVFTGDLLDRGCWGFHVLAIVLMLQQQNPDNVILCYGNHETCSTSNGYGGSTEWSVLMEKTWSSDPGLVDNLIKAYETSFQVVAAPPGAEKRQTFTNMIEQSFDCNHDHFKTHSPLSVLNCLPRFVVIKSYTQIYSFQHGAPPCSTGCACCSRCSRRRYRPS